MTTIEKKIQKKVDEINKLIALANLPEDTDVENSYDGKVMVVDTSSTWQEPAIYEPIVFRNGVLYIEYFEPYSNRTKKEKILKRDLEYDGYGTLLDIAKMYKKALKRAEVKFEKGGMVYRDLFEDYENQPEELAEIVSTYMEKFEEGDYDYDDSKRFLEEVESVGYTFDYGLDNEPYGLRPIGVELSQIQGYEDMDDDEGAFSYGGKVKPFEYKENNSTIMINGTKEDVKKMYLDYKNNFLSVSRFAEYYNISETQANSIINQGRKYAKEDGYYASGGVTENYVSRKELNTITIKKGNQKLTYKISDVLNGAYKLESGAKLEDIAFYVPKRNIVKVQLKTGKDFKPANGYWIKDSAKPIHVTKFVDGGMTEKEFMQNEINSQRKIEEGKIFKKYRVNVYENSFPFVEPLMTDNFIEAVNFAKKTIEEQRKYRASSKDLFAEISQFTPIEKRPNVRYPYQRIASFSEEDFKSSKFDNGGEIKMIDGVMYEKIKFNNGIEDWYLSSELHRVNFYCKEHGLNPKNQKDFEKAYLEVKNKMATGGKVSFKEKARAIAKNFEGKRVEPKYQKEYGKVYDKTEAKEVGNKIAGSQKSKYDAKAEKGAVVKKGKGNHKMKATTDLARKIRKEGEKWTDAIKRASQQLK